MARGKHATHAAATRAREDAISEAETLRRQVAKLTKENAELREKLADQHTAHAETIRNAQAQIDAGASDEVDALRLRLEELRQEITDRREGFRLMEETFTRGADALQDAYMAQGMGEADSKERCFEVFKFIPYNGYYVRTDDLLATMQSQGVVGIKKRTRDAIEKDSEEAKRIRRLQRAKGVRR